MSSVGSSFTVVVVEEEHYITSVPIMADTSLNQSPALGYSSILFATRGIKPAREMVAVPERTRIMAATVEPVHKMATTTMLCQVTATIHESCHQ